MNEELISILNEKKQIILQGAPGTGKTYKTSEIAVQLCDGRLPDGGKHEDVIKRYRQLVDDGRIAFTTFHQSYDYEQFVEGIAPIINEAKGTMTYRVRSGIFKNIAENAAKSAQKPTQDTYTQLIRMIEQGECTTIRSKSGKDYRITVEMSGGNKAIYFPNDDNDHYENNRNNNDSKLIRWSKVDAIVNNKLRGRSGDEPKQWAVVNKLKELAEQKFVLIIDEINRGNISKIFGELITLLETDKRQGGTDEAGAILPYSQQMFRVPQNLYIIGTMNTADRSVGYVDYAIRRRFAFYTIISNIGIIENYYAKSPKIKDFALSLYKKVEQHIKDNRSNDITNVEDIMIGHSYFLVNGKNEDEMLAKLDLKLVYEIQPLLDEYYSDGLITEKFKTKV